MVEPASMVEPAQIPPAQTPPAWPPTLPATARAPRLPAVRVVRRARLVGQLGEAVTSAQLTVVCAPPGAGKTVLAADWARSAAAAQQVVWLTLGPADRFPGVFWWHVVESLAPYLPDPEQLTRPSRFESVPPAVVEDLVESLLSSPEAVTLVLDGFEAVDHDVSKGVEALLRLTGDRFRLVLLTRRRPDLALHRYRLEGRLAEVGADDLRFTPKTVAATLAAHGVRPSPAAAQILLQRTEGWAAAVRLVALELQGRSAATAAAEDVLACLAPSGSLLGEYVQDEVVAALSAQERDLLRRCSVVDTFSADLADWLVERTGSAAVLDELTQRHQLLRRADGATQLYRMHPLLREAFLDDLRRCGPAEITGLHLRAAEFLAASGRASEAVDQAVLSGDRASMTAVLLRTGALAVAMVDPRARSAVERLTAELSGDTVTPRVAVVRAVGSALSSDHAAAGHWLREAGGAGAANAGTALTIAMVETHVRLASGDLLRARATVAEAETHLLGMPRDVPWVPSVSAALRGVLGQIRFGQGDFDPAAGVLTVGLLRCAESDVDAAQTRLLSLLALVEACRGNLTRAQELAETADRIAADVGITPRERPVAGCLAQAWVAIERQELGRAQHWLGRAARIVHGDDPALASVARLLRVRMMRDRADLAGARALVEPPLAAPSWVSSQLRDEATALGLGTADRNDLSPDRSEGLSPEEAARILVEAHDLTTQSLSLRVERYVSQAHRHLNRGEPDSARALVVRALELGEPEQVRRPFLHAGGQVRALIRTDPELVRGSEWLASIEGSGSFETKTEHDTTHTSQTPNPVIAATPAGNQLPEPLTEREREVLNHLADLLNTQEIAAAMFISVNTVRTHVRHILDKLAVGRRNEAVRRARELGLV